MSAGFRCAERQKKCQVQPGNKSNPKRKPSVRRLLVQFQLLYEHARIVIFVLSWSSSSSPVSTVNDRRRTRWLFWIVISILLYFDFAVLCSACTLAKTPSTDLVWRRARTSEWEKKRNGSSEIGQRIVIVVVIVDKQCDLISTHFFFLRSDCVCVCVCFLRSANVMRAVSDDLLHWQCSDDFSWFDQRKICIY